MTSIDRSSHKCSKIQPILDGTIVPLPLGSVPTFMLGTPHICSMWAFDIEAHDYPLLRWVPSKLKALAIHSDPGTHLVRRRGSWELSWRSEALSILNLASWIHSYIRFQSCLSRVRAVTILIWYWIQFRVAHLPYYIQMRILPNTSAWAVQHRARPSAPKSLVCPIQNECSFDVCSEVRNYIWIIEVAVAQDAPANNPKGIHGKSTQGN